MYLKNQKKKECSGCTACVHACPKKCISIFADNEGFYYPQIDNSLCIECGLCEKVCPFYNPKYENTEVLDVYASYIEDVNQRKKSTSGGLFYAISKWVIENGGVVYGAAFDGNFKLKHIGVDNFADLEKLRGSKYLQSFMGDVFPEIKEHLKAGRWVYFTGCGCQVAGLNAFLRRKYDTLITSDLVCHGAPSQLMFDWHIDYLQRKENAEIVSYSFRDLEGWGGCESYEYQSLCGLQKRINPSYILSPYLYSFMYAYNYRYSCYECKYAQLPRQGDITLADYWGVADFFSELERANGVSLILVNSKQGQYIWDNIKSDIIFRKSNIKDASLYNGNLVTKTKMPAIRSKCYEMIKERGYDDVAQKEFRIKGYWKHWAVVKIKYSSLYKKIRKYIGK